jgi:hydroxymethylbilane synthase
MRVNAQPDPKDMSLTTATDEAPRLDTPIKIGTRGSELALWQAHHVRDELRRHWGEQLVVELVLISTEGDRILDRPLNQIGGKGLFVNAIEEQLVSGAVDLAVHSMKDLPGHLAPGLAVVCTPPREDPRDALVLAPALRDAAGAARQGRDAGRPAAGDGARDDQPAAHGAGPPAKPGARRPLAARQRADAPAQAGGWRVRRDLAGGRGAVRLGLAEEIDARLDPESFCPAACQGILALECRETTMRVRRLVAPLGDADAAVMAAAERAFLARLDGGCQVPMGCHATLQADDRLHLRGVVADPAGRPVFTATREGPRGEAAQLGRGLAELLLQLGADEVLAAHRVPG